MSNKKQFEEMVRDLPLNKLREFWGLTGTLQFYPAFSDLPLKLQEKLLKDEVIKDEVDEVIKNSLTFDETSEYCRQLFIENVWRILEKE